MVLLRTLKAAAVAGAVAGATLVALPPASAVVITSPIEPYAVAYTDPTGVLGLAPSDGSFGGPGTLAMAPGTNPSTGPTPNNYKFVWHGANGDLWTTGAGPTDTGIPMIGSPSLVTFPDGNWEAAVHGTDANLHIYGTLATGIIDNGKTGAGLGPAKVAPGTNPSIAATPALDANNNPIPDAYTIGWQDALTNDLWIHGPTTNSRDTGYAMARGTSPSITRTQNAPVAPFSFNYYAAFQGSDGHLWEKINAAPPLVTTYTMAAGASPNASFFSFGNNRGFPTAFEGSNGHLFVDAVVGDTGLPMMAGTNPSVMVTPVDEAGHPLGGIGVYAAYTSNTGVVSVYGYNVLDGGTHFTQSTGWVAAPGTTPSIVSQLDWIDGGTVAFNATPATTAPVAAHIPTTGSVSGAPAPLHLPSKPTTNLLHAPVTVSDTCASVRAHLKQYAARGIKQVTCQAGASAAPPIPTRSGAPAPTHPGSHVVTPHISGTLACTGPSWAATRTEECLQNYLTNVPTYDTGTGAQNGNVQWLVTQDLILSVDSTQIVERLSFSLVGAVGPADGLPETVTLAPFCDAPCTVTSPATGSVSSTFNIGTTTGFSFTLQDSPGQGLSDTFNAGFRWVSTMIPGFVQLGGPATWNAALPIRCDKNTPGLTGSNAAGCVIPAYPPNLVLPVSVYGGAAVNVYAGETWLPGTPGLSAQTPLTRGNPNDTNTNSLITCDSTFQRYADPNPFHTMDSCDEYPFASTQQSGGKLNIAGSNCLEILPTMNADGNWTWINLTRYTFQYPQVCLRGHVNGPLNNAVGGAVSQLYNDNRVMVGDPFTVQVTN